MTKRLNLNGATLRRCEYTEEHVDGFTLACSEGGNPYITMRCTEQATWIVVFKGIDAAMTGDRYCYAMRYCSAHATQCVNDERAAVAAGHVRNSVIKVIDPFTDMAITTYPDRPEMGVRYQGIGA